MPDERFWTLTLRELNILIVRSRRARARGSAQIVQTLANIHRDREQFPDPFPIEDFLPPEECAEAEEDAGLPQPDQERLFGKMRLLVAMMGGDDLTAGLDIKFPTGEEDNVADC